MKQFLQLTFLLITHPILFAQEVEEYFTFGIESNAQYYAEIDDDVENFDRDKPFASNNYFKGEYHIKHFTFGIQVEGYNPQALLNYSPAYNKEIDLSMYYGKYTGKKLSVDLGHFFEQYGSGMILRSWEDRQLGINNAVRGVRASYKLTENINISAFYGNQKIGFKTSQGKLMGFNTDVEVPNFLNKESNFAQFGLSYVGRCQKIDMIDDDFEPLTHAFSGRYLLNFNNFYTGGELVLKTKDALIEADEVTGLGGVVEGNNFYGNGLQLDFGYSQRGFAVNTTLRRLENMSFYTDREYASSSYNELLVNYLPALTKQHDYSLSNIYVYQAQPSIQFFPYEKAGELGGQLDIYYRFKKGSDLGGKYGTKVALNAASWWGLGAHFLTEDFPHTEVRRVDLGFLDFGKHYFSDISLEVRKKFSKNVSGIFTAIQTNYNKEYIEESSGYIKSGVLVADLTFKTAELSSLRWEGSHLFTKDDKKNWAASTIEYNFNPQFSIFASDMYNYGNNEKKEHFYLFGGSFTKNSTRIALNYGKQRGGVLCVGGVCREVPEATGLTLNFSTAF
jgi:hypothetical protein